MSRGFGSTLGTGSTDVIATGYTKSGSDQRSYSLWYYRNGNGAGNFGHLFAKSSGANFAERAYIDNNGGLLDSRIIYLRNNSSGTQTASVGMTWVSGVQNALNTWNHLLICHDQSSGTPTAPNMWLNGVSFQTSQGNASNTSTANNTDPFLIGNRGAGDRNFDGLIAHFAVWDGILLTGNNAIALTAGAHPATISPANLVCYLPLDGMHAPELDFILANAPGVVTGTRAGATQPLAAPVILPLSDNPLDGYPVVDPATIAVASQYAVSIIGP